MEEQTKSFWWKFWGRPLRFFTWATAISVFGCIAAGYYFDHVHRGPDWSNFRMEVVSGGFLASAVLSLLGLILSAIPWTRFAMSWALRRWFFCAAAVVTLIALFYAEEDWRGKRAWEQTKRDLDAKGFVLDWDKYIPPPVPDDQNFFKAPKMQEWFVTTPGEAVQQRHTNSLIALSTNRNTWSVGSATNTIVTEAQARDYLAWSDQFVPQFNLIREALKRPYARMDGDYSDIFVVPFPNFVVVREVARILSERTHCYLVLNQPDKALIEITLVHDMSHMLQGAPTGKPMTLVGAMINVAVTGLYVNTIGEGLKLRVWQEPQLAALQEQLNEVRLLRYVAEAFHDEPAATCRTLETEPLAKIISSANRATNFFSIAPRGWFYQNLANVAQFMGAPAGSIDLTHDSVLPAVCNENDKRLEAFLSRGSPFKILAAIIVSNFRKAIMTTGRNQNLVNQALVACALERYHLAHGQYPESLDSLVPQFIDELPHDVINGGEPKYRKTDNSFVLYSIGWNEKDDGGTSALNKDGSTDWENGDWVWPSAPNT